MVLVMIEVINVFCKQLCGDNTLNMNHFGLITIVIIVIFGMIVA